MDKLTLFPQYSCLNHPLHPRQTPPMERRFGGTTPRPPPQALTKPSPNHRRVTVTAGRLKAGNSNVDENRAHVPFDSALSASKSEQCGVRTQVGGDEEGGGKGRGFGGFGAMGGSECFVVKMGSEREMEWER
ncbi:hypothetical protein KC340_g142 [Hortaea werneckii]|nr:hypothetical protein KC340_g142 [Hortaea werneckii]